MVFRKYKSLFQINAYAQNYANILAKKCKFEHNRKNKYYGENLYARNFFSHDVGKESVICWYNEIKLGGGYNFNGSEKNMSKSSELLNIFTYC